MKQKKETLIRREKKIKEGRFHASSSWAIIDQQPSAQARWLSRAWHVQLYLAWLSVATNDGRTDGLPDRQASSPVHQIVLEYWFCILQLLQAFLYREQVLRLPMLWFPISIGCSCCLLPWSLTSIGCLLACSVLSKCFFAACSEFDLCESILVCLF